jgi:MYXO-CTERM domain-containing protein
MRPRVLLCLFAFSLLSPAAGRAEKCPNLVIVLDKSGSMRQAPNGQAESDPAKQKWGIAVRALTALVNRYNNQLPIGLSLFPSDGGCGTATLNVPPAYDTAARIIQAMNGSGPGGSTPTCTAVTAIAGANALKDATRKQFLLLVTDGEPTSMCCGGDPIGASVTAVQNAFRQSPSVRTFVLGFGALTMLQKDAMNRMAVAGGVPRAGDPRYYSAESDVDLRAALDQILTIISGEFGMMACDDTCYGNPCPMGQKCIRSMCTADPCAGVTCPAGQYCYTDGTSKGVCTSPCAMSCPAGQRCDRGMCVADPCGGPCGPDRRCNMTTRMCELDPACAAVRCGRNLSCLGGTCVDDPCSLVSCPPGTGCLRWTGMCQSLGPDADPGGGQEPAGTDLGGCSCSVPGTVDVGGGLLLLLFGLLGRRRRR